MSYYKSAVLATAVTSLKLETPRLLICKKVLTDVNFNQCQYQQHFYLKYIDSRCFMVQRGQWLQISPDRSVKDESGTVYKEVFD